MALFPSVRKGLLMMEKHFVFVSFSVKVISRRLCTHAPLRDTTNTDDCHERPDNGSLVGERKASLDFDESEDKAPKAISYNADDLGESCLRRANPGACSKRIQSLCNCGEVDKAHKLLNAMIENKICLKPHLFNAVIDAYGKAGRCQEALEVCNAMRMFGFRPHKTSYHALMSSYFKQGKVGEAMNMFDKMQQDGWWPNEVTRSIVAYGLHRSGHAGQVKALFQARCGDSGTASTSLCNSMLEYLYRSGDWDVAEEFGRRIFSGLCHPNVYTYATIIRGRCAKGKLDEARKLLLEMNKVGIKPNLACYGSLISGLCKIDRTREAYELFEDMRDNVIDVEGAFSGVLLKQLAVKGMVDEGMRVCKFLLNKGILVECTTVVSLLEGLSNADRLDEAKPFLESIRQKDYLLNSRTLQQALHALERRKAIREGGSPFRARDPADKCKSS